MNRILFFSIIAFTLIGCTEPVKYDLVLEWKAITKDSVGFSTLYGAGHAATAPSGHPTLFSPDMETINDSLSIEDWLNHRISKKVDFITIIHTLGGWMCEPAVPTLDYEQINELIQFKTDGQSSIFYVGMDFK